ncbi:MAG TPA: hypothetical protein VH480_17890 [Streptosporangiaceae bacterium]|jgi:chromosome segregation ATPase
MPDELDEIRRRLDTLESRMNHESDLRAMMDLDQASLSARLDAQDRLLRALSHTQSDHTSRLIRLEEGQTRLEGRVSSLEEGQRSLGEGQRRLEGTVGRVEIGIQTILALLQNGS